MWLPIQIIVNIMITLHWIKKSRLAFYFFESAMQAYLSPLDDVQLIQDANIFY